MPLPVLGFLCSCRHGPGCPFRKFLHALGMSVADLFKSRSRLEVENLLLRHQLSIALRQAPIRLRLRGSDRALLTWITRVWPSLLGAVQVVQPETILRWHRAGFEMFWRWKSRHRAGRPRIDRGLRDLIRRMSRENPLWGASRIHGELLMLGFAQQGVSLDFGASLPSARQRPRLWTRLHVSGEGDGYPRPTYLSSLSMAKWLR